MVLIAKWLKHAGSTVLCTADLTAPGIPTPDLCYRSYSRTVLRVLILFCMLCQTAVPCVAGGVFSIEGKVIDRDGNPIANADLYVVADSTHDTCARVIARGAASGSDGSFILRSLPVPDLNTRYTVIALSPSGSLGWSYTPSADDIRCMLGHLGSASFNVLVPMSPLGTSEGRVLLRSGEPVVGATVMPDYLVTEIGVPNRCTISARELAAVIPINSAVTDSSGRYTLSGLPARSVVNVSPAKRGLALDTHVDLTKEQIEQHVSFMSPSGSIRGRVLDDRGQGASGVVVEISGYTHREVISASDGRFSVSYLLPGGYEISITNRKPLKYRRGPHITVEAGKVQDVGDLRFRSKSSLRVPIRGRVLEEGTGVPIPGISVVALDADRNVAGRSRTRDRGEFVINVAPHSMYEIWCIGPHPRYLLRCAEPYPVSVAGTAITGAILEAPRVKYAYGMVLDSSGHPAGGVKVWVRNGMCNRTYTNKYGFFTLDVPPEIIYFSQSRRTISYSGVCMVRAEDRVRGLGVSQELDISDLSKRQLILQMKPLLPLRVIVKDTRGNPLPGASVRLDVDFYGGDRDADAWQETNAAGEVTFRGLVSGGHYGITAALAGYYYPPLGRDGPAAGSDGWQNSLEICMLDARRSQAAGSK